MQVYAAMIANMDAQIGTLMETLKQTGRDKNTLLVFLTDNGANPAQGFYYESTPEFWKQFDNSYDNVGRKGSFISYGPHWANVSNAPYANYHKTTSARGGINTDFMISGPGITRHGKIDASTMAVYDVAPTLYEFAGIDPNKSLAKKPVLPMIGVSFKRYLTGEVQEPPRGNYGVELHHQAAWSMANGSCDGWCRAASPPATRRGSCLICTTTRWRRMMSRPNIPIGSKP